jgi:hypothetical protein
VEIIEATGRLAFNVFFNVAAGQDIKDALMIEEF